MSESMKEPLAETFVYFELRVRPLLLLELSRMMSIVKAYQALAAVAVVRYQLLQAERLSQLPEMVDMADLQEVHTLPPGHARVVSLAKWLVRP